jgi:Na+:H+ antiporter, NhaA family
MNRIKAFFHHESAGGILLMLAAAIALLAANSPLSVYYAHLLSLKAVVAVGDFSIAKPLLLWINDGLMALFFLLVGLELKREMVEGELNSPAKVLLPGIAALGGMVVPAAIYSALNWQDPRGLAGWAIPTATDIAFAIGILSLLGKRVPVSLKLFLVSLAIFDDLGAIIIIALFYTAHLSMTALCWALAGIAVLLIMNSRGVVNKAAYALVGLLIWVSLLKSGVHATLAGVAIAFCIPLTGRDNQGALQQPLKELEKDLHSPVAFGVLPLFAFANAGLSLQGLHLRDVLAPVPLGIVLGLWLGKPLGVMAFTAAACALRWGRLPTGVSWSQFFGMAMMCGVGFTMSLFIGSLAFTASPDAPVMQDRLGILVGSGLSALMAYAWLRWLAKPAQTTTSP